MKNVQEKVFFDMRNFSKCIKILGLVEDRSTENTRFGLGSTVKHSKTNRTETVVETEVCLLCFSNYVNFEYAKKIFSLVKVFSTGMEFKWLFNRVLEFRLLFSFFEEQFSVTMRCEICAIIYPLDTIMFPLKSIGALTLTSLGVKANPVFFKIYLSMPGCLFFLNNKDIFFHTAHLNVLKS